MKLDDILPQINMYTDGGADPNPGKGGYGVILVYQENRKELSSGYRLTTNNRMELMAVIAGLEALKKPSQITVHSDSQYVVKGIELGWAKNWKARNWIRKSEPVPNANLWARLLERIETHKVSFNWIKGHNGHPENERCDELADAALNGPDLLEDDGYIPQKDIKSNSGNEQANAHQNGSKIRVEKEGDPCRNCKTPVLKHIPKKKNLKPHQTYYFEYSLICPNCHNIYNVEDAKREVQRQSLFDELK